MAGHMGRWAVVLTYNFDGIAMDKKLLTILACPICKGDLVYKAQEQELICYADALAFPVRDDMPVMLVDEARSLSAEEREQRK